MKIDNITKKPIQENEQLDEIIPALAAAGGVARGVASAVGKAAGSVGKTAAKAARGTARGIDKAATKVATDRQAARDLKARIAKPHRDNTTGLYYAKDETGKPTKTLYITPEMKQLVKKLGNDQEMKAMIIQYLEGGATESVSEAKEGKNLHMTHLEDLILDYGYTGAQRAIQYVDGVRDMLAQGGGKQKVTVKWDGAPAVFAGIDPSDGKFFVGTKSVFAKNSKMVKDKKSLDEYYGDTALHEILGYAFANLKKLGIKNVLQGDLLFSPIRPPEEVEIDGEKYLSFRPNTITYAVASDSDLAKRISRAKMGIVFHTTYEGDSVPEMQANFGADISSLNNVADVWVEDAYYTDLTGSATLTDTENKQIKQDIAQMKAALKAINKSDFDKFRTDQDLGPMFNIFMNQRVRSGQTIGDPKLFVKDFLVFYKERIDAEVAKLKTGPEGKSGQAKLEKLKQTNQFVKDNMGTLLAIFTLYGAVNDAKLAIVRKLNKIDSIGTFLKTPDGYEVTNPEGYVAIGNEGGAVKFNDRLEFNRNNFLVPKDW